MQLHIRVESHFYKKSIKSAGIGRPAQQGLPE
jgi:hypothetical protein